jgi:hypothetical protein
MADKKKEETQPEEDQAKTPVLEPVKIAGPCGEENPCGGGFGARD